MSCRLVRSQRIFSEKQFWHVLESSGTVAGSAGVSGSRPGASGASDMVVTARESLPRRRGQREGDGDGHGQRSQRAIACLYCSSLAHHGGYHITPSGGGGAPVFGTAHVSCRAGRRAMVPAAPAAHATEQPKLGNCSSRSGPEWWS